MMQGIGKTFLLVGGVLVVLGVILILAGRFHVPFGKLPGDIVVRKQNYVVFVPLVSMLILSVLLTLIVNVILRFFR
ncbi:MAG: DUF2905 domain-containing protein [Thermovirgaceae bacterium]